MEVAEYQQLMESWQRDPHINLCGGRLTIKALEIFLAVLQSRGECRIVNCGEVSLMELGAQLAALAGAPK